MTQKILELKSAGDRALENAVQYPLRAFRLALGMTISMTGAVLLLDQGLRAALHASGA